MSLFRIRTFLAGNVATFLAALARGGLQFLLIIWLQGIWLPMHGFTFEDTPLWSAIYMLPMTIAFMATGPLSGYLSDKHGAHKFAIAGLLLNVLGFILLFFLPANFSYIPFAAILALMGVGMGMFSSPNMSLVMGSVPAHARGVASGMRATFQNTANTLSIVLLFTLLTVGLSGPLPSALAGGLVRAGVPQAAAGAVSDIPPSGALFAMFLGYNPLGTLLPQTVLSSLSVQARTLVLGKQFFPTLLSGPFMSGASLAFAFSAILSLLAAGASALHDRKEHALPPSKEPFIDME